MKKKPLPLPSFNPNTLQAQVYQHLEIINASLKKGPKGRISYEVWANHFSTKERIVSEDTFRTTLARVRKLAELNKLTVIPTVAPTKRKGKI